ncbi:hypothetical protein B484DRAFT_276981 [Ochromonadaceae sp. CCMP2298]|nr:hypothetical protein B484DRAFT_426543 [Ochromonadaceae sp. CCMP2298]KAJ1443790.1 hypothetical protein B484DRAFT_276981 [Ochromonadaceae sp. CCMP2298]|mmetsp:Transcript_13985/g.30902  ORF Transcript_13985/g.30902 Transcript_13985/m.30902 type:complete len:525 (+) Transcript_13985:266-1840(+)
MSAVRRPTKNEKRRSKNKEVQAAPKPTSATQRVANGATADDSDGVEIEYVSAKYDDQDDIESVLDQFRGIFEKFSKPEDLLSDAVEEAAEDREDRENLALGEEKKHDEVDEDGKLSKRKKKLLSRLSVAELKQLVARPDVVEAHDVTSSDPRLLVYLKAYKNTVAVPRHWCHIRKYLTGKVGMEKPAFQLPEFIAETGIAKIRDAVMEQEAAKKAKQKSRERVRPKMGKIDIDYQVLHDAFFKYQTKPKLTGHGDLYYEGKEYEVSMKEMKPGNFSAELQAALGISEGVPPPWLINMQRYGPPPSYPSLKVPGLNAPLPAGAQYGYQPGGWGKPPVDEYGRPLYGDVFGTAEDPAAAFGAELVDKTLRWGELEILEYSDAEDEDESQIEDIDEGVYDPSGAETPSTLDGGASVTTGISGLETPDTVDLRKRSGVETPSSLYSEETPGPELYHVIQERKAGGANQMFGSDHVYVLPGGKGETEGHTNGTSSLADGMLTEESAKMGKKRKMDSSGAAMKRIKEFKF